MALKVILYFTLEKYGWSEVHYTNHAEISEFTPAEDAWIDGPSVAATLFRRRRSFLPEVAQIVHMRVSKIESPGEFLTHDYDGNASFGEYPKGNTGVDEAETFESLLVILTSGTKWRRRIYIGGMDDSVISGSQLYKPGSGFKQRINNYLRYVSTAPFAVRSRPAKNALTDKTILTFEVSPSGRGALMSPMVRPAGNPLSWYVLLRGVVNPPGWNGVHRASLGTGDDNMLIGPTRRSMKSLPDFSVRPNQIVSVFVPTYNVLTNFDTVRIVSRKRGRPFGLSRGRRS